MPEGVTLKVSAPAPVLTTSMPLVPRAKPTVELAAPCGTVVATVTEAAPMVTAWLLFSAVVSRVSVVAPEALETLTGPRIVEKPVRLPCEESKTLKMTLT